jgi:hypothetical protein
MTSRKLGSFGTIVRSSAVRFEEKNWKEYLLIKRI